LLILEVSRGDALSVAAAQLLDPVDNALTKVLARLPDDCKLDRRFLVGHYWLLVPGDAPGRDRYLDSALNAPLREVRGTVWAGGWWGQFSLMAGRRYLVARFSAESNYMSELLGQRFVQNAFRRLCQEVGGAALLLQCDSIERYDDLRDMDALPVTWPEWQKCLERSASIDAAVACLLDRL
jgi:hypothetical protein